MFSAEKVKVLKKCMKQIQKVRGVSLLNGFGETSAVDYKVSQNVSKFIQTICYAGQENENLVESRVKLIGK